MIFNATPREKFIDGSLAFLLSFQGFTAFLSIFRRSLNLRENKKEPRAIVGHFSNGDLLFIVIDGSQEGFTICVTLELSANQIAGMKRTQIYNFDGG